MTRVPQMAHSSLSLLACNVIDLSVAFTSRLFHRPRPEGRTYPPVFTDQNIASGGERMVDVLAKLNVFVVLFDLNEN